MDTNNPDAIPDDKPQYPGGEHSPAYRIAFQTWVAIFLLVICTSLLHYLGSWYVAVNR